MVSVDNGFAVGCAPRTIELLVAIAQQQTDDKTTGWQLEPKQTPVQQVCIKKQETKRAKSRAKRDPKRDKFALLLT